MKAGTRHRVCVRTGGRDGEGEEGGSVHTARGEGNRAPRGGEMLRSRVAMNARGIGQREPSL
jgi:hypothetical protein